MEQYKNIIYTKEGGVATITLNRPDKRNAFNPDMIASIQTAVADARADNNAKVLVIAGAGQAFCTGGDVKAMADQVVDSHGEGKRDATAEGVPLYRLIHRFPKPTVAVIDGPAIGGGMEIALACDIRIASDRATFSEAFIRRGLMPAGGGTYILPRLIGIDKACRMIWSGDLVDAAEALRMGLVTEVVAHDALGSVVAELAAKLAKAAPLAVKAAKQAIYRGLGTDLDSALNWAAERQVELAKTQDHKEGSMAFVERREPVFRGE